MIEFMLAPMKSNDYVGLRIDFLMLMLTSSEARRLSNMKVDEWASWQDLAARSQSSRYRKPRRP